MATTDKAPTPAAPIDDPHAWLEEVLGEKPLEWAKSRNAECLAAVGDPKASAAYTRIKGILDSKDKIPHSYRIGAEEDGQYYNFWQDEVHVQGIWRRTTLASYKSPTPEWKTVLDLDALPPPTTGTAKTWVWHGSSLLDEGTTLPLGETKPFDRCLIRLSPGGSDADTAREFDLTTETFVAPEDGGFALSDPAKTRIRYRSRDEVIVGTDFGGDGSSLTDSGYPRVVKSWRRGTPLAEAVTIFEGLKSDIAASQYAYHDRGQIHEFQVRSITFYTSKYFYRCLTDEGLTVTADKATTPFKEVPIPEDAQIGTFADLALVTLRTDLTTPNGATFTAGSMISLPMVALMANDWTAAVAVFTPTPSRSHSDTTETKDFMILKILEDVKTTLEFFKYDPAATATGGWTRQQPATGDKGGIIPAGEDVSVSSHCRDSSVDNLVWFEQDGYLVPSTLCMASAEDCCATPTPVKAKPAMFNAEGLLCEQQFATSADGTRIPYFVIRRKDCPFDGTTPTLLDAYGGFEVSSLPGYYAGAGAGWLERGGAKVIANIRGGGEYGPSWHQAAIKAKRYKCFEDVEAVAQALIASKLTAAPRLACIGGSNGGLLVGNLITRPIASRLFGAAVCQVPLLDMKRYTHLLAGASWAGEYGDPDKPEEWAFLRKHSPYHLLRHDLLGKPEAIQEEGADPKSPATTLGPATASTDPEWVCPKVLFTTSTRDDRVHPGHLRKMVQALREEAPKEKVPCVLAWENVEGGHGGAADNSQRAEMWALTYNFLAQRLGGME